MGLQKTLFGTFMSQILELHIPQYLLFYFSNNINDNNIKR